MLPEFADPTTTKIVGFLIESGIPVCVADLPESTFLPGIMIDRGALVIDPSRLLHCGDLLHEAGHLAVLTANERAHAGPDMGSDGGFEMAAIAWSYAAALHLQIEASVVFHADGYRGSSQAYIENFREGRYLGVPMLQWLGLTADPKQTPGLAIQPYPHMLHWLRT